MSNEHQDWVWENRRECKRIVPLLEESIKVLEELAGAEGDTMIEKKIIQWHYDRNLIKGSTDKDQYLKLIQECGELSDNICKGKDVSDDIGDILVVLINIAERNGLSLGECMRIAYDDIKHRKGLMVGGVFVKEDG